MPSSNAPSADSSVHLRALLGLRETSDFRCHGVTKKDARCRIHIATWKAHAVEVLLDKAAAETIPKEKFRILRQIIPLALCKTFHQDQQGGIITTWEKLIKGIETAIKLESEGGFDYQKKTSATEIAKSIKPESPATDISIKGEPSVGDRRALLDQIRPYTSHELSFQPYSRYRATTTLNTYIKAILQKPLTPKTLESTTKGGSGCVYAYSFPTSPNLPARYLKIGYSANLPGRLKSIESNCRQKPRLLCSFETKLYMKVEPIVHAHLANERLRADPCHGCGCRHKEWFDIKLPAAAAIMGLWTAWSLREPYGEKGGLKAEWRRKLEKVDLSDRNCWEEFVYGS